MIPLTIEPTVYSREDGLDIIKLGPNLWAIRKRDGIVWFYSDDNKWVIASLVNLKDSDTYCRPFDQAMELLQTLPDVRS